jgi:hypothetical protein
LKATPLGGVRREAMAATIPGPTAIVSTIQDFFTAGSSFCRFVREVD